MLINYRSVKKYATPEEVYERIKNISLMEQEIDTNDESPVEPEDDDEIPENEGQSPYLKRKSSNQTGNVKYRIKKVANIDTKRNGGPDEEKSPIKSA